MKSLKKFLSGIAVISLLLISCSSNYNFEEVEKILLDTKNITIRIKPKTSRAITQQVQYKEKDWAYTKLTVQFEDYEEEITDFYPKDAELSVTCKNNGQYKFMARAYKEDLETIVASSNIKNLNVNINDGDFDLTLLLSNINTYEITTGIESHVKTIWAPEQILKAPEARDISSFGKIGDSLEEVKNYVGEELAHKVYDIIKSKSTEYLFGEIKASNYYQYYKIINDKLYLIGNSEEINNLYYEDNELMVDLLCANGNQADKKKFNLIVMLSDLSYKSNSNDTNRYYFETKLNKDYYNYNTKLENKFSNNTYGCTEMVCFPRISEADLTYFAGFYLGIVNLR